MRKTADEKLKKAMPAARPTASRVTAGKAATGGKTAPATKAPPRRRGRTPGATRDNLLKAAIQAFAELGFDGTPVQRISRQARSNDRMLYYYFGSKEKLFVAVLESIYREMWDGESALALDYGDPVGALNTVIRFTMDHYLHHPEMVTLLNTENLHKGRHVSKSRKLKEVSSPALSLVSRILDAGVARGLFRDGLDPMHVYISILALNYFYFSNRYTLSAFLGTDLLDDAHLPAWRQWVSDMILRSVRR